MRLSRRSEYGLRALTDLVRHTDDGPIALATLAERERHPLELREPLLAGLKHGRIVRLLDGALAPVGCVSLRYYTPCSCPDEATCALRDTMIDVRDAILAIL